MVARTRDPDLAMATVGPTYFAPDRRMLLMIKNAVAGTTWHLAVVRIHPMDRREPASVGTSKKSAYVAGFRAFFNLAAVNRAARHFAALSANLIAIEFC